MSYNIAIDGPAGAGKSTIAKRVAKELGFIYVDTGAMYRAIALYFLRREIDLVDENEVSKMCGKIDITIEYQGKEQQVLLNGENVNSYIRSEEVGNMASVCASNRDVRLKLMDLQKNLALKANVVMDGRDIGTYVLPAAQLKIFLTASAKTRANRRFLELEAKGVDCNMVEIEKDIIERDKRDMNREIAPLRQADNAVLIDSSELTIEQVVDTIIELYNKTQK